MNRAILDACLPCLIALAVSFLLLWVVAKLSGARPRLWRLRELHGCQAGGVQSLAFVLTLPIFLMIVLFIVQVSQVMIGLMTVNYAAYASARAASVWVPALVDDGHFYFRDANGDGIPEDDSQNRLPRGIRPKETERDTVFLTYDSVRGSAKYEEIFTAAAMACMPIAPSRDLAGGNMGALGSTRVDDAMLNVYPQLAPAAASNTRMPQRIRNKLAYCLDNTIVELWFIEVPVGHEDAWHGPTYNPRGAEPEIIWIENEVGWQDAVTVKVWHHFALLPGPGHFLSNIAYRPDGSPDEVARLIDEDDGMHKTVLSASATMTIEGLKSYRPYRHDQW